MSNANFSSVQNDLTVKNLTANNVTFQKLNDEGPAPGLGLQSVVGYAPTSFATQGSAVIANLNSAPGQAAATTVANGALNIPIGAVVISAQVSNNSTTVVGGTDFDIGLDATQGTTSNTLFDALPLANLNSGNFIQLATPVTGVVPLAAANFVTVTVNTTANTTGDLAVKVNYLLA